MNIINLIHVVSDIYTGNITDKTRELCKSFELIDPEIWHEVSAIRYIAGTNNRIDFDNIANEAKWELEDDLGMHE